MEIEKKFLVDESKLLDAIKLNDCERYEIEQAYVSIEDTEVRIRKIEYNYGNYQCFMTIKSSGDLVRNEVEFDIPYAKYRELIGYKMYKGNIIDKLRYHIQLENNLIAELDIYGKELFGLLVVEVEFKTEEDAKIFQKPNWFGEDVTNDKKYKNKNLALKKEENNNEKM